MENKDLETLTKQWLVAVTNRILNIDELLKLDNRQVLDRLGMLSRQLRLREVEIVLEHILAGEKPDDPVL